MLEFLFWFFVIPAVLAAALSIRSGRRFQDHVEVEILGEPDPDAVPYLSPVTLILPLKGADHDLAQNLLSLAAQDYPDYELLIVAADPADPAVRTAQVTLGDRFRLVVAGPPPDDTGEKVNNLLAAVAQARPQSQAFAFADSDGQVEPGWLRALVQPLADDAVGAATGFRWYLPENGGFWPLLRSAWDSAIAGSMRPDGKNFAWGGAMALRRAAFDAAKVADFWRGSVSDDYRLAQAIAEAGLDIRFVPAAMVAAPGACSAGEFLDWAVRQLIITKVYRKKIWIAGFIAHVIYCGAMLVSVMLLATGDLRGLAALVITQIPGMAKGAMRGYAGRLMFPTREDWFDRYGSIYFWYTPIATWVWLYAFIGSAKTSIIQWRGYTYRLDAPNHTTRL